VVEKHNLDPDVDQDEERSDFAEKELISEVL